jgi:hypothetical protein
VLIRELGEISTLALEAHGKPGAPKSEPDLEHEPATGFRASPGPFGPGIKYCFASDVPWQVRALAREVTANITRLVPCMQFQELAPSRFDSNLDSLEVSWCDEEQAIVFLTPRCDSSSQRGCFCETRPTLVDGQTWLLLNLGAPSCQRAGVITHELVHAAAASRGHGASGRRLAGSWLTPVEQTHDKMDAHELWAQAVLATSDVTQLEQAHMVIPDYGARCFDIPERGSDICVGAVGRVCEVSGAVAGQCCSCGGGLRVACSSGQGSLGRGSDSEIFAAADLDPAGKAIAASMDLFHLQLRRTTPLWIVPLAVIVASYLVWIALSLAMHRFHSRSPIYTTAASCASNLVLKPGQQDGESPRQMELDYRSALPSVSITLRPGIVNERREVRPL